MPYVWDADWTRGETWFNLLWNKPFYGEDSPDLNWDDYRSLQYFENDPLIGSAAKRRMNELANDENERYWSDLEKNYGFDSDDLNYPIRSGRYGRGGYSTGSIFEATDAVMDLYSGFGRLMKW